MSEFLLRPYGNDDDPSEPRQVPGALFDQVIDLLEAITSRSREQSGLARAEPTASARERRKQALVLARQERDKRQERQRHFARALFGEPAWELLLTTFIHECEGDSLTLTKAAELIDHPLTTTLRWVEYLEASGLLVRKRLSADRRVVNIRPTERALASVETYFLGSCDELGSTAEAPAVRGSRSAGMKR